jgi:hypothetical protein
MDMIMIIFVVIIQRHGRHRVLRLVH